MIDGDRIRDELMCFELQAFAELFHSWAIKKKNVQKPSINRKRLEIFRPALRKCHPKNRRRQIVPHDLVQDEYRLVYEAVKQVRQKEKNCRKRISLKNFEVTYTLNENNESILIQKPFPALPNPYSFKNSDDFIGEQAIIGSDATPSEITRGLISNRFGMDEETVKKQESRKAEYQDVVLPVKQVKS